MQRYKVPIVNCPTLSVLWSYLCKRQLEMICNVMEKGYSAYTLATMDTYYTPIVTYKSIKFCLVELSEVKFVFLGKDCISGCSTSFDQEKWCGCGQNQAHKEGTLYDMTIRRASGYILHT